MPSVTARISDHFRLMEFACHDGVPVPTNCVAWLQADLVLLVLEPMRSRFGTCLVTSGYRHRAYNAAIGGAADSRHIYQPDRGRGFAADVHFAHGDVWQWAAEASGLLDRLLWGGGVGTYPRSGFVHVDSRRQRARWAG